MAYSDKDKEREYKRQWYEANKHRHLENVHRRVKEHRQRLYEIVESFKTKCAYCPESESCCLDFHHLDPTQKESSIADACRNGWAEERLRTEIAKCLVVCKNCHAKLHAGKLVL